MLKSFAQAELKFRVTVFGVADSLGEIEDRTIASAYRNKKVSAVSLLNQLTRRITHFTLNFLT
jgi:hypothetical protein